MSIDTRKTSADGYELTFAVNYLAHAQLIASLQDVIAAPGRIELVGSNTYWENRFRKMLHVPPSKWDDPLKIAQPAAADAEPSQEASGYAYSNSKLAILYYAHELQRHVAKNIQVIVFEPGFMLGSGLGCETPPAVQAVARGIGRLPGVPKPANSAPMFASVLLDTKWSHLQNGDFVVKNKVVQVQPFAKDLQREQRLRSVTEELLKSANK